MADVQEQGCGAPRAPAYWMGLVRVCTDCIKNWYTLYGHVFIIS